MGDGVALVAGGAGGGRPWRPTSTAPGDAQAAAARLSIHRSRFCSRLDRARDVTGADLHDGPTRRELHTGLRIARLAGLRSRLTAAR